MKKINIKKIIKDYEIPFLPLEFIKWKLIDLYRAIKYPKKPHLYGIYCLAGLYGQGKTVTMCKIALDYKKKFGDDILISTNFGFALQDFAFTDIKQLTEQYSKPIVFFFDELQNEFPATEKVFPKPVRQALTLNRKGNGKMIYWASQDFELVHKTFRRLTLQYGQVRTLMGRFTRIRWYLATDYQLLSEENDVKKRMKIRPIRKQKFVQSDYIRSLYNSFGWDNGESLKDSLSLKEIKK